MLTTEAIELGKQMAASVKERESVKKTMKTSHLFSSMKEPEECLNSSTIKSTCDDEDLDLSHCKVALQK